MSAIYLRWLHQWALSTWDDFINVCYLPEMTSLMGAIYLRWLHQWVLSTWDHFINGCNLPEMTSSMSAIYLRWITNECYLLRWLYQWVLSTWDESQMNVICWDDCINGCYLPKVISSLDAIYLRQLHRLCYLPEMTSTMVAIYTRWFHQYVLCKTTSSMSAIYLGLLHQWLISTQDDFINICYKHDFIEGRYLPDGSKVAIHLKWIYLQAFILYNMPHLWSFVNPRLSMMIDMKTQFNTENAKSTVSKQQPFCFYLWN